MLNWDPVGPCALAALRRRQGMDITSLVSVADGSSLRKSVECRQPDAMSVKPVVTRWPAIMAANEAVVGRLQLNVSQKRSLTLETSPSLTELYLRAVSTYSA